MSENFDDNVADNWSAVAPSSAWTISAGPNRYYSHPGLEGAYPKAIYDGATWTKGYVFSARLRLYGSGTGNLVGVMYHYLDPSHYQAILFHKGGGTYTAQLWRANGSSNPSLIASSPFTTPPAAAGSWVTVTIQRGHDDITTIKVNDELLPALTQTQPLAGTGKIGLVDNFAEGRWDDISVTLLPPPENPPEPEVFPEITILGNGLPIADNDASPAAGDGTDFGSAPAPDGTVDRTFTIQNTSMVAALTLGPVILTGDFSLLTPPPATIPPGGSASFSVRFSPTLYGVQPGTISIGNNDPARHPYNFAIQGNGTHVSTDDIEIRGNNDAEELVSSLIANGDVTPTIVDHTDFGSEFVDGATTARTFTVHNLSSEPRALGAVTLSGNADFTVIAQPASTIPVASSDPINADGRTSFSIQFDPSSPGLKTATVTLTGDGYPSPYTFMIQGTGVAGTAPTKQTFPRLGGVFYRNSAANYGSTFTDPVYQQNIAKYDVGVLNMWKLWGNSTAAMNAPVNAIKALNPHILLGNYTLLESNYQDGQDVANKLSSATGPTAFGGTWQPNDWWAHHPDGSIDSNAGYPSQKLTNPTAFTTPDANGDRFSQFYGKWAAANLLNVITQLDFVFSDNAFYKPRRDMDWDRNGADDNQNATTVRSYYTSGMAAFWAQLNVSSPGLMIMGNYDGLPSFRRGFGRDAAYQRRSEGALGETQMGASSSTENYSGWYNMMNAYWSLMDNTRPPHLVLLGIRATDDGKAAANPNNYGGGAAYAFSRYAIASVLMDNGYAEIHGENYARLSGPWFDEFDLAGAGTTGWLGGAVDPVQRVPRQNGIFARRFEQGLALVNPRTGPYLVNGNLVLRTAQSIDLGALFPGEHFRRFAGTQDPQTNNGQPVTGPLTLQPGDGLILQRYNTPPIANAGPDQTLDVESDLTAEAVLDGRSSSDPDGDALSYTWTWADGSAAGALAVATLPLGTTVVTLTVDDGHGATASDTVAISVIDRTPPVITAPAGIVAEATDSSGATVAFEASAADAVSGPAAVSAAPASGSVFPLGVTTVTLSATDAAGNGASGTFTVTVQDTTPPVISVPADIVVDAPTVLGIPVSFTASAADAVDGARPVSFSLTSGSVFLPGTTMVTATASDTRGNTATVSFTVTVRVPATAVVNQILALNGTISGSIRQLSPQNVTLNGSAGVTGDLLVPGTPVVQVNGTPGFGGIVDGAGSPDPSGYRVTLNGGASLGRLVRRSDPVALPAVAAPSSPAGTRSVSINTPADGVGAWATVRNLTLNGGAGTVAVPAGVYGSFTANGGRFVLGVPGATVPSVYEFQSLVLNGGTGLQIAGPVIVIVKNSIQANSSLGADSPAGWLDLRISGGGLTLNGQVVVNGYVTAPQGSVTINGSTRLTGGLAAGQLVLNGGGRINLLDR